MATTAPINLNRLLGLDESLNELDPTMLQMLGGPTARGGKPDLDDALNNEYFKRTGIRLAPGQLPEPVPEGEEAIQAGKTWLRKQGERVTNLIPSFGGDAEAPVAPAPESPYLSKRTRQDQLGAPGVEAPIIRPGMPAARDPLAGTPLAPTPDPIKGTPLAPTATSPVPPASPRGDEPSFLYGALQKHTTFVRDVLEGGGTLISDLATGGFGAALKVSDILNYAVERVASGKPFVKEPDNPTFFRDLLKKSDDIVSNITYTPKSDIAKNVRGATGKVFEVFHDIANLPAKALAYAGHISEDTAAVVGFATELYLFYKLDRGVRDAAPELRSKIANMREKFSKGTETEARAAAEDLANAASKNPNLDGAMNEARGKFRDEGEAEAAARGPVGPRPGPPTPEGMYYDPADIAAYTRTVQEFSAQFRRDNPNASIRDVRDALETLPKPEPKPIPTEPPRAAPGAARPTEPIRPEAPAAEAAPRAQAQPEPTRVTPSGEVILSEDLRNYVAEQRAAGVSTDQIVRDVRPSVDASISNTQIREAIRPAAPTAEAPLRPEDIPPGEMVVRPRVEPTPPEPTAPIAAAVIPPEVSPSSSGDLSVAAAVPPQAAATVLTEAAAPPEVAAVVPPATRARELYESANTMGVTDAQYRERLAELKGIVREGLRPNQSARAALARLGFTPEEIPLVDKQLKGVRAAKPTPAVQTAAAEAALENAPPGTEVEIPAPAAEAVVDTSPAIEKPKRKRRVVKAPDEAQLARNQYAEDVVTEMRGQREQRVNQRAAIQAELNIPLSEAGPILERAFAAGLRPNDAANELVARGVPLEGAQRAAGIAFDLYISKQPIAEAVVEPITRTEPGGTFRTKVDLVPTAEQWRRDIAADEEVMLMRAEQRTKLERPVYLQQLLDPAGIQLSEITDAFDKGLRPPEVLQSLIKRGVSDEIARTVSDVAFDSYVRGYDLIKPEQQRQLQGLGFAEISDITSLDRKARFDTVPSQSTEPTRTPMQIRVLDGKPDALFIDTAGLQSRTTLVDIERQMERGTMSGEVAAALRSGLMRQAKIAGVPIEQAQNFTGQELMREATRIAAETGIDLYVKKGKNYELVPKDVVRTDARINSGDDLKPVGISKEAAGAYVESKTSDIGPDAVAMIREAVELGIDISEDLPASLLPHYRAMLEQQRAGIDTSERRSDIDIAVDMETIKEELRTPPGERVKGPRLRGVGRRGPLSNEGGFIDLDLISDAARMAAQRLQADMRKLGKGVREFLFGARPEDVAMFENYLKRINNPAPPDSINPANMRFDPTTKSRTDRVVKHRVISEALHLEAPPLWQSEVAAIQAANDIKPGGSIVSVKTPYWQHVKANTQFIYHSYRTAQKNVDASIADLQTDLHELGRGFSTKSLENIGANGYLRQGPDGQRILTYNKVTPTALSPAEKRLQANLDVVYADFWVRINEERVATGREPLPPIDNYQTFARTQSLLNHLNMGSNLIMDSAADIMAKYAQYKSTNFPYTIARQGAVYSAEMNALKILDTYAQSALKEIFLGPFLGKLHELIETKLPDPVTGKETWLLKDEKPGLYTELRRWADYLATGSNVPIPETARYWLSIANRNLGYAMLSFGLRSGAVQVSTLRNTYQSLGAVPTTKGVVNHLMDIVSGGKKFDFALRESEVLASRKFIDAYNDTAAAIVGRRPGDFLRAIARGQVGEIQAAIGGVGMKVLEIPDMQAAVMSWNAAYDHFTSKKVGYSHKDAIRAADDLVVRSQGSTMPGDLAGIQRNAIGKAITQFQTFAISDWNFLTNEVFSKQQGKVSNLKMVGNIIKYAVATQLMNEFYRMLHIQPPGIEFIRDWSKKGSSTAANIGRGLSNFLEPIPLLSSTRHGRSVGGPLVETGRDLTRALRDDPMAPSPFEPGAVLLGVPGARAMSKYIRAKKRGETEVDSLLGWYSEDSGAGRRRPERRARPSR